MPPADDRARTHAIVVGRLVHALRLRGAWSQTAFAAGWGRQQVDVSRVERGAPLDLFAFQRLADFLGCPAEILAGRVERAWTRCEIVARGVLGLAPGEPAWWSAAWAASGHDGVTALADFAVAVLLSDEEGAPADAPSGYAGGAHDRPRALSRRSPRGPAQPPPAP